MTEHLRRAKAEAKRPRLWLRLAALLALMTAGVWVAVISTASSHASVQSGSTLAWDGKKGADACAPGTTGNMLWIFNPHSSAVPQTLTVTWSTGQTDTYTGWKQSGQSQDWHLTVNIVGAFPPKSAYVSYTGALGKNPILTISGCNESTTSTTTTTGTTTPGTTTTGTTTGTTTVTTPGKTKVIIKKKVIVHVKRIKVPVKPKHRHTVPAPPVQGFTY